MAEKSIKLQKTESKPEAIPVVEGGKSESGQLAVPIPVIEEPASKEAEEQAQPSERRQLAKSASLVMLGNLGSSIMGMIRQIVVAALGAQIAGPFNSAILPAQTFYDFLINGSVSGALIPTFTDYSE